ncbi:MAG: four helix bundle protein [Psychroflexus sp.]
MKNLSKIEFIEKVKLRSKRAAIEVIYLTRKFDKTKDLQVITYQIVKSSSSVAANYRAASRAISDKALYSKMKITEEEADETVFWLEVLEEIFAKESIEIKRLHKEYLELLGIISKTNQTMRARLKRNG